MDNLDHFQLPMGVLNNFYQQMNEKNTNGLDNFWSPMGSQDHFWFFENLNN
jgi:hypothetical protein